jgi:hypothetical protein
MLALEYLGYYLATGFILSGAYLYEPGRSLNKVVATVVAWPVVLGILVIKGLVSLIKE